MNTISAFEYVTVFISIILGLGVTQILTGIADLIHQHQRVKIFVPHAIWMLIVLVLHVQEWWVIFQLKNMETWRLPMFLFIILYPTTLFITARLLFPLNPDDAADLKQFYLSNFRKIFLFGAILATLSLLDDLFVRTSASADFIGPTIVLTLLGLLAWQKPKHVWIHYTVAIGMLILLAVTIIIEWDAWLITN